MSSIWVAILSRNHDLSGNIWLVADDVCSHFDVSHSPALNLSEVYQGATPILLEEVLTMVTQGP